MSKPKATSNSNKNNQTLTQMGYVKVGAVQMGQTSESSGSDEDLMFEVTPPPKKRPKIESDEKEKSDDKSVMSEGTESLGHQPHGDVTFHFHVHYASIEDIRSQDQLHPVYGYTKHQYGKATSS